MPFSKKYQSPLTRHSKVALMPGAGLAPSRLKMAARAVKIKPGAISTDGSSHLAANGFLC
jgi:hypothetical protein